MLPDFPNEKALWQKRLLWYFKEVQKQHAKLLTDIPRFLQHEGDRCTMEREDDGEIIDLDYQEFKSEITIDVSEVSAMSIEQLQEKLAKSAEDMAGQLMGHFYQILDEATRAVDNVVDCGGGYITPDKFFELFEKIHIDFDEHNQPIMPVISINPNDWAKLKDRFKQWSEDPKLRAQFDKIIDCKREIWRDREINRKLVD